MAQFWPQNKEWVDLEALENPRRSLLEYGTVGTTKCSTGTGKQLIIVDFVLLKTDQFQELFGPSPQSQSQNKKRRCKISSLRRQ